MFDRLMRGHDRLGQLATDLKILAGTVLTIIRFKAWSPGVVPAYPFRCQHCSKPIRLATAEHPASRATGHAAYRDPAGHYSCDGTFIHPHRPMPSIR